MPDDLSNATTRFKARLREADRVADEVDRYPTAADVDRYWAEAEQAHADFITALNAGITRPTMGDADERVEWTYNQPLPMRYALTPVAPYRLPATPREPLPLPAPDPTLPRAMVVIRPLRMRWWHRFRLWFFRWWG